MTRPEAEQKIFELMQQIKEVVDDYTEDKYFTGYIMNNHIQFNNTYWDAETHQLRSDVPILYFWRDLEENRNETD